MRAKYSSVNDFFLLFFSILVVFLHSFTVAVAQDTYFTDFREYSTGQQPSDWTQRWETSNIDFEVTSVASERGEQILQQSGTNGDSRSLLAWDKLDNSTDIEIITRHRFSSTADQADYLFLRASGSAGAEDAYHATYLSGDIFIVNRENGSPVEFPSEPYTMSDSTWYWTKLTADSSTIELQVWEDGQSPSDGVSVTLNDTTHIDGWAGVGKFRDEFPEFDWVGAGINGKPAPSPAVNITIDEPQDGASTNEDSIKLSGSSTFHTGVAVPDSVSVTVNGTLQNDIDALNSNGEWTISNVNLADGDNQIVVRLHGGDTASALTASDTITVTKKDTVITIQDPNNGDWVSNSIIDVSGDVSGPSDIGDSIVLTIEGADEPAVQLQADSTWDFQNASLPSQENELVVSYYDGSTSDPILDQDTITVNVFTSGNQVFTDFREYSTNQQPSDWTQRWETTNIDFEVVSDLSERGDQVLEQSGTNDNDRSLLAWDELDGATDVEIITRHRFTSTANQADYLFLRASGSSGSEDAYQATYLTNEIYLINRENGSPQDYPSAAFSMQDNTWYWTWLTADSSAIEVRVWEDGNSPSDGVSVTLNDLTHTSGWVGVGKYQDEYPDFDWVGAGINGDPAPSPAVDITINKPNNGIDTKTNTIKLKGSSTFFTDIPVADSITVTVNGTLQTEIDALNSKGNWSIIDVNLEEGTNEVVARLHGGDTNSSISQ